MSRTLHEPSYTRYRAGGGDCPFRDASTPHRACDRDRICRATPREHPGGVCPDQRPGAPLVAVVDRSYRHGSVTERVVTADQRPFFSRYASRRQIASIAASQQRAARQRTRAGLRELTKALTGGGVDLDVCDDDAFDVTPTRPRNDAIWLAW